MHIYKGRAMSLSGSWIGVTMLFVLIVRGNCVYAYLFKLPIDDGITVNGTLNTTITAGAGVRTEDQAADLIGKANLNPDVCTGTQGALQSCQGVFRDQVYPARHLAAAPGAASINNDDGDLNYRKGDLISGVGKITQDLKLSYHNYGLFARWLYFYDQVNEDFTEHHPNRITAQNYLQVGRRAPSLSQVLGGGFSASTGLGVFAAGDPAGLLGRALVETRPYGQPTGDGGTLVYGRGDAVDSPRNDPQVLSEIGHALQYLDAYVYGDVPLWDDRVLSVRLGRQVVNWGESTTYVVNSISQANPLDANNFYRIGRQNEEIYIPVSMIDAHLQLFDALNIEAFYQLEWQNTQEAAPGSFFSTQDVGSNNIGVTTNVSVGNSAEDLQGLGSPIDNAQAAGSGTTSTIHRIPDREPRTDGQFGVSLKHYAESILGGTDFGIYFLNYHSRLPIASVYAANPSCLRREGNALQIDATTLVNSFQTCPDGPLLHVLRTGEPAQYASSDDAPLDSARFQLEYPENIHLLGLSFNTTLGGYSLQGEAAYRPNQPLQVALTDLQFASYGPTLTRCSERSVQCSGSDSAANFGYAADGSVIHYGASDFVDAAGNPVYPDTIPRIIGALPGSARAFPNFVVPYRGGVIGENPACPAGVPQSAYTPDNPCYIRGYERLATYNFDLSTTRVFGASDNFIGADQIVWVTEFAATWVPELPALDQLQFQAPGVYYSATAGADGSGANGSRQACSTNPACSYGPDGLRFNPHQADLSAFPDKLSWGYRVLANLSYENVLPNIGVHPALFWSQDVQGTSPGPAGYFVAGSKQAELSTEIRYKSALSLNLGYTWFFGGGQYNLLHDRDYAQFFLKYQF